MTSKLNQTTIREFFLVGFQGLFGMRYLVFVVLLLIYCATLGSNLLIVYLVSTTRQLYSPMYFFLSHLSICDIVFTTCLSPTMLNVILNDGGSISVGGCIVQVYARGVTSVTECLLLTVMSYDRYLAICKPLHYSTSMSSTSCHHIVGLCWVGGFVITLIVIIFLSILHYCGPNVIDHFSCDIDPLVQLSCSDTTILETVLLGIAAPETIIEMLFILTTYVCIAYSILRISSETGRQKAFSTCSSHLAVVCTYYATLIAVYVFPSSKRLSNLKKFLSLMYTVVTPLFNPIIYSLKNQEIKKAFKRKIFTYVICIS